MRNRLITLRERMDIKPKDLYDYLGIAKSTYSEWENNKKNIPLIRLIQIADYFSINIDYLLYLTSKNKHVDKKYKYNPIMTGKRLKQIRVDLGLSLRKFGDSINISYNSLFYYEKGTRAIPIDLLVEIGKKYNISADWIVGRSEDKYI